MPNDVGEHMAQLIRDRNDLREQLSRIAERLGRPGCRGVIGGPISVLEQTRYILDAVESLAFSHYELVEERAYLHTLRSEGIDL